MNDTMTFFCEQVAWIADADFRRRHRPTNFIAGVMSVHFAHATFAAYASVEAAEARWHDKQQQKQV